jgi:hypothetical protein
MEKLSQVMKKALGAYKAAHGKVAAAEAEIRRAEEKRERANQDVTKQLKRLRRMFREAGGVTIEINAEHADVPKSVSKVSVNKTVHGKRTRRMLSFSSPVVRKLDELYARYADSYVDVESNARYVSLFTALVERLCTLGVLSKNDWLVAIDERYFVKDDNGKWFGGFRPWSGSYE